MNNAQPSLFGDIDDKVQPLGFTAKELHSATTTLSKAIITTPAFDPFMPRPSINDGKQIIYGNVPSKSNCYRIITFKPKKDESAIVYSPEQAERIIALFTAGDWNAVRDELNKNDDGSKKSHASLAKTKELGSYEKEFEKQLVLYKGAMIEGEFGFEMDVYYPSRRSDLDNSLKVVLDCLQRAGAYKNDNNCIEIHAKRYIDKNNPRIEFKIIPLI